MDKGIKLQKELAMGLPGAAAEASGNVKGNKKVVQNLACGGMAKGKKDYKKGGKK